MTIKDFTRQPIFSPPRAEAVECHLAAAGWMKVQTDGSPVWARHGLVYSTEKAFSLQSKSDAMRLMGLLGASDDKTRSLLSVMLLSAILDALGEAFSKPQAGQIAQEAIMEFLPDLGKAFGEVMKTPEGEKLRQHLRTWLLGTEQ